MLFFTSSNFVLKAPGCGGGRVVNVFRVGLLILLGCQWFQLVAASSANVMLGSVSGNERRGGYDIPIQVTRRKAEVGMKRRGDVSGTTGMGNNADLLYSIPIGLGEASDDASYYVSAVNLDTGSSDLWVVSDACQTGSCAGSSVNRYPSKRVKGAQTSLQLQYGDSTTGTFANGILGRDTAVVAGLAMTDQAFGVISSTNNPIVKFGTAGIFGLGFPSGSKVQQAAVIADTPKATTDDFLHSTYQDGPLITRLSASGALQMPQFSITLARNTIDIGGNGMLTIGKLPDGINNSSLTWVPVRLYKSTDGGLNPPNFAPNDVYPYRWEIDIDGVFLDGKKVPDSTIPANGVNPGRVTALIDTGNSLIRGPSDMVNSILTTVSPGYNPSSANKPTLPCAVPHTMAFQIGGKMFPVDPRDFIGASTPNDATTCVADNLVSTDPPSYGALFSWSLGDPFMKSNLVAFHYGNITHPSVDPPRIGFLSLVPNNADDLLRQAVSDAQKNGGNFEETLAVAPTASAETASQTTISATSTSLPSPSSGSGSNNVTPSRIITVTMQAQPTDAGADAAPSTTSVTNDNAAMANLGLSPGWTSLWLGIVLVARFLV